jgi:hypothetical protein
MYFMYIHDSPCGLVLNKEHPVDHTFPTSFEDIYRSIDAGEV